MRYPLITLLINNLFLRYSHLSTILKSQSPLIEKLTAKPERKPEIKAPMFGSDEIQEVLCDASKCTSGEKGISI